MEQFSKRALRAVGRETVERSRCQVKSDWLRFASLRVSGCWPLQIGVACIPNGRRGVSKSGQGTLGPDSHSVNV